MASGRPAALPVEACICCSSSCGGCPIACSCMDNARVSVPHRLVGVRWGRAPAVQLSWAQGRAAGMPFGFVAAFVEARCKGRLALHPRVGKGVGSGRYGSWHVDEKGYSKVTRRLLQSHWAHLAGTLVQSRGETDDTAHMSWVLLHGMAQMYRSYAVAVTAARSCNLPQNSMAGVIVRLKQAQARRPTNIAQVHGLCMEENAQSPSAEASGSLARSQSMLYCSANANQIHDHAQVSCLPQHSCTAAMVP